MKRLYRYHPTKLIAFMLGVMLQTGCITEESPESDQPEDMPSSTTPPSCVEDRQCLLGQFCIDETCKNVGCDDINTPICDHSGLIHGNECYARKAHVDFDYEPICDNMGQVYGNRCAAQRNADAGEGDYTWAPVCGADGKTYGNACGAAHALTTVAYEGECVVDE